MQSETIFNSCAFCLIEKLDLYKCPKCFKFYCSTKCYRNKRHTECSENFYKNCIEDQLGYELDPQSNKSEAPLNRPHTTFEEYMKGYQNNIDNEDQINPQIEVR